MGTRASVLPKHAAKSVGCLLDSSLPLANRHSNPIQGGYVTGRLPPRTVLPFVEESMPSRPYQFRKQTIKMKMALHQY